MWRNRSTLTTFKSLLLQNHRANFNQSWHKASLGKGIQICSIEGPRPSQRGDICEIEKIHRRLLKIFFSRITGPISTKVSLMGIQVYSNEVLRPSSRGDNSKRVHIHWQHLNIFFSRTTGPISTKLSTKHPGVGDLCSNKGPSPFLRGDNFEIVKIHWQFLKNWTNSNWGPNSLKKKKREDNCKIVKISDHLEKICHLITARTYIKKR